MGRLRTTQRDLYRCISAFGVLWREARASQEIANLESVSKLDQGLQSFSQHEADGGKFQERRGPVAVEIFP